MGREDVLALFADDIAAGVFDLLRSAPGLLAAFAEVAWGSGLHLNARKCVVVPLWTTWSSALRGLWREQVPPWGTSASLTRPSTWALRSAPWGTRCAGMRRSSNFALG